MLLQSKVYDVLKFIALIFLPAFNTLFLGFGQLWHWSHTAEIAGSIALVDTFLGALIKVSSSNYNKSDLGVDGYLSSDGTNPDTGHPNLRIVVTRDPKEILDGSVARLKIGDPPPPKE